MKVADVVQDHTVESCSCLGVAGLKRMSKLLGSMDQVFALRNRRQSSIFRKSEDASGADSGNHRMHLVKFQQIYDMSESQFAKHRRIQNRNLQNSQKFNIWPFVN